MVLCTRSGLCMHPLRLYHGSPLYAVSCITLTLLVSDIGQACVLVVALHGFWFVARRIVYSILLLIPYLFAIYRPVTHTGLHATCLKYCVCAFGGSVASVRSWRGHIFGTPHFRPSSILGRGPPPHACSAP